MKILFFEYTLDRILIRYYLMMLTVVLPVFAGVPYLAFLALPIFLAAITGVKFEFGSKETAVERPLEINTTTRTKMRA